MTRALIVMCAVVGAVAVAGAQQRGAGGGQAGGGAANPPAAPAAAPNTYDPSKTQTISGCLKQGAMAGQFMVADAMITKGGAGGTKKNYTISGVLPPKLNLQSHMNHKVELEGTIGEGDRFSMHNFKMVSPTCP